MRLGDQRGTSRLKKPKLVPTVAVALLTAGALSGCSVGMALSGHENPDIGVIREGATRAQVESELGEPEELEQLENGSVRATYEYEIGDKSSPERAAVNAAASLVTLGIYELIATPAELTRGDTYFAIVTYDTEDKVTALRTVYEDDIQPASGEN